MVFDSFKGLFSPSEISHDEYPRLEADVSGTVDEERAVLIKSVSNFNDVMDVKDYLSQGNLTLVEVEENGGLSNAEEKLQEVTEEVGGNIAFYRNGSCYILTPPEMSLRKDRM